MFLGFIRSEKGEEENGETARWRDAYLLALHFRCKIQGDAIDTLQECLLLKLVTPFSPLFGSKRARDVSEEGNLLNLEPFSRQSSLPR